MVQTRRQYDRLKIGAIVGSIVAMITILGYIITLSTVAAEVRLEAKESHMWMSKNQSLPTRVQAVEAKCDKYDKVADASIRVEGKIDTMLNELVNMNRRMERVENKIDNGHDR